MHDDLFRPTAHLTARSPSTPQPWLVGSQFWLAFFGGMFALVGIALLNSYRLAMTDAERLRMVVAAVSAFGVVTVGTWAWVLVAGASPPDDRTVRVVFRGAALVLYAACARIQRPAARRYDHLVSSEPGAYASLWIPGFVAAAIGGTVQGVVSAVLILPVLHPDLLDELMQELGP